MRDFRGFGVILRVCLTGPGGVCPGLGRVGFPAEGLGIFELSSWPGSVPVREYFHPIDDGG
jgi:hypothetical protein